MGIKAIGAVVLGFVTWLVAGALFFLIQSFLLPGDTWFYFALLSFLATIIGLLVANLGIREKMAPYMRERPYVVVLGILILLWVGSGILVEQDEVERNFKIASLVGHTLAVIVASLRARGGRY